MLMPDGRVYTPGYGMTRDDLQEVLTRLQWSSVNQAVEMVIHPAATVEEAIFGDLQESRVFEYKVFSDPELAAFLYRNGVEIVGFNALRPHA